MIQLKDIISFPAYYKKRNSTLKDVMINNIYMNKYENEYIITSTSTKYKQEISFIGNTLSKETPIKIFCNCESFKFEFAHSIFIRNSLRNSDNFDEDIMKRSKEKNIYNIPCGCKHIVALGKYVFLHINKFNDHIIKE